MEQSKIIDTLETYQRVWMDTCRMVALSGAVVASTTARPGKVYAVVQN